MRLASDLVEPIVVEAAAIGGGWDIWRVVHAPHARVEVRPGRYSWLYDEAVLDKVLHTI